MSPALVVIEPDVRTLNERVQRGETLTLAQCEAILGCVADLMARVLVLEERLGGAGHDRRAA